MGRSITEWVTACDRQALPKGLDHVLGELDLGLGYYFK